ncbi:VWA domain-containing protein [Gemmata sp. G18]|uniref:VWA domain-containing protein n=1 Tax=Gemmata palustris TaxID=2822762 RepID=A0ABS5BXQ7_9BACT|nr:vWA domain-containing protein [Gemmata palustris]MBP3958525.1 VWA domain-containing protein [Gemmata palustris]
MPAPKFLSALPKPVLFGLYGAIGGLLGALLLGEPIMLALGPKQATAPTPAAPEPRLAVSASDKLQIYQGGTNKLLVQIARDAFDDDVTVRVEGLPAGVTAHEAVIPAGKTAGEVELRAAFATRAGLGVDHKSLKVIASARAGGTKEVTETTSFALTPLVSAPPEADIVFVLDVTGSMQKQIDGLKDGIGTFANDLREAKVDARFGCIAFRDLTEGEPSQILKFRGSQFTDDASAFSNEVARLRARGGGDDPESSLEAIIEAAGYDFRKGATRSLILITDAPPRRDGVSVRAAADALTTKKIDLLHLVINSPGRAQYREVQLGAIGVPAEKGTDRGKEFSLDRTANESATFTNVLLPEMTKAIIAAAEAKPAARPELAKQDVAKPELKTVKAVQSDQTFDASSSGQLVLAVGAWTGAIAGLVCLFLLGGQHHYLRGGLPSVGGAVAGLAGGLVVGVVGGAAGQGLFLLAPGNEALTVVFQLLSWALLGGLAGAGLSIFVPNLKTGYGLMGGALGGAVGAIGYILVTAAAGAQLGRLAGGLALGLCIGLMVAVVEAAFRRAWLEVRYGPREVITVNLGAEPVKVGGDARACTVWARGAADVALRYFIRDGKVICTDVPAREEFAVSAGDTRAAGNVIVVVRTGSGAEAPPAAAPRPIPPVPKTQPVAKAQSSDNDVLPLPALPAPPSFAQSTNPHPAPVSAPSARPSSPPAPAPVRNPDACPTCGRKTPGRSGSRYCVVCDQTY